MSALAQLIAYSSKHFVADMNDIFFGQMVVRRSDYFLGFSGLSQGSMTGRLLENLETVMLIVISDKAQVSRDTNSTMALALAASMRQIRSCMLRLV
jgi:UDP-GlcNAc3NAcA epimerase